MALGVGVMPRVKVCPSVSTIRPDHGPPGREPNVTTNKVSVMGDGSEPRGGGRRKLVIEMRGEETKLGEKDRGDKERGDREKKQGKSKEGERSGLKRRGEKTRKGEGSGRGNKKVLCLFWYLYFT